MNLQDMDLVKEQLRKYKQENYELESELRCRWLGSLATGADGWRSKCDRREQSPASANQTQ